MNLLLIPSAVDHYSIDTRDPRLEHVRGVLRLRGGDRFDVGAINGPRGKATVTQIDEKLLNFSIQWEPQIPPPPPGNHLIVGMPRPATARKIITEATAIGVRSIHFVCTQKSDPAYAKSRLWTTREWKELLIQGAEQAFDTFIPELKTHDSLEAMFENLVPEDTCRIALDVYEAKAELSSCRIDPSSPVFLAIGPERGWAEKDRRTLRTHGFQLLGLGPRVLRVESAVIAALAITQAKRDRM